MRAVNLNIAQFIALGLQPWPLVVVIEDCYVPGHVKQVVEAAREATLPTVSAIIACRAYQAEQLLAKQLN